MKHKLTIFKLLRKLAESPAEIRAVESFIGRIDGKIPPIENIDDERKKFDGQLYRRNNHDGRYYCAMSLPRAVWHYVNGEIPNGCEIHHIDGDRDNNDIDNLQLLTRAEHEQLHRRQRLGSKRPLKTFVCVVCGAQYEAVDSGNNKYCSRKCSQAGNPAYERDGYWATRNCQYCGKSFVAYKNHPTRFCSKECQSLSAQKRETKTCEVCGAEFTACTYKSQRYCSKACADAAMRKREVRRCSTCGTEFSVHPCSKKKFCFRECVAASQRKREVRHCQICGTEFTAHTCRDQKFCSKVCANAAMRKSCIID